MASLERDLELMGWKSREEVGLGETFPLLEKSTTAHTPSFCVARSPSGHQVLLEGMYDPLT
jgi:hypothetical protein